MGSYFTSTTTPAGTSQRAHEAYRKGDVTELFTIHTQYGELPMKEAFVDDAVSKGNVSMTRMLTGTCNVCPTLEAVQMALVAGHTAAATVALGNCKGQFREYKDIKQGFCRERDEWTSTIPEEFRY
jgi:hypothetical protein